MDDLVERLRRWCKVAYAPICGEAADRIQELQAERDEWKAKYEWAAQKLAKAAKMAKS